MKKKFNKEIKITSDAIINAIKEKFKEHIKIEDIKIQKTSPKDITEIMELIEIEKLDICFEVGTPFISSTIFLVILLSTLIPVLYEKTDNKNGKLFYNVSPNFNKFEFVGEISLDFKITPLKIIWIMNYLKKTNNRQIKRRRNYEQSSYRGFDEYGYE